MPIRFSGLRTKSFLMTMGLILVGAGIYAWYEFNYCSSSGLEKVKKISEQIQLAQTVYSVSGDKAQLVAQLKILIPAYLETSPACFDRSLEQNPGVAGGRTAGGKHCPPADQQRVVELSHQVQQWGATHPNAGPDELLQVSLQIGRELNKLPGACRTQGPQGASCPMEWDTYDRCVQANKVTIVKQGMHIGPFPPQLVAFCIQPRCPR